MKNIYCVQHFSLKDIGHSFATEASSKNTGHGSKSTHLNQLKSDINNTNPKVFARQPSGGRVTHDPLVDLDMLGTPEHNQVKSVPSLQDGFLVQVLF